MTGKQGVELSIVMPVFNEQGVLQVTIEDLSDRLKDIVHEIILVDDGSEDDTWQLIQTLQTQLPQVKGIRFTRNFGHQSALFAGISAACGNAVVTMDSDGEHPPELVMKMVSRWRDGAKVVQSIRDDSHSRFFKRTTSALFYKLFSWLAETKVSAGAADFRLMDRAVVDLLLSHPGASRFLRGFIPWSGFSTEFIEYMPKKRLYGKTKFSLKKMFGLARRGILGFSVKPLRLSMLLGTTTCFFSLAHMIYTLIIRVCYSEISVPGWASIAGLLSLIGGVQLLVIGILGEYVGVVFESLRNQPLYVVDEKVGFEPKTKTSTGSNSVSS